jgi:hypothetical protein
MNIHVISLDSKPVGIVSDPGHGADVLQWFHTEKPSCSMDHACQHEGYSVADGEPDCRDVAALLEGIAARLGVTMRAQFVPFSQSRNASDKLADGKPWPSLNWRVTLARYGRDFLITDYGQGIAYAPASKLRTHERDARRQAAIAHEIERGTIHTVHDFGVLCAADGTRDTRKPIPAPALGDVLQSLASDASALDEPGFEAWADSLGYDRDSRKAEEIYRACLDIALKLQATLGGRALAEIRLAASFN